MRKAERERRRREKRAAVKAKAPVLVLCGDVLERGRVALCNANTGALVVHLRMGLRMGAKVTVSAETEGRTWCRGWYGETPDAFRAQVALVGGPEPRMYTGASVQLTYRGQLPGTKFKYTLDGGTTP